jgi:hypothetical protein
MPDRIQASDEFCPVPPAKLVPGLIHPAEKSRSHSCAHTGINHILESSEQINEGIILSYGETSTNKIPADLETQGQEDKSRIVASI